MFIALVSPEEKYDSLFMSNYASLNIVDQLKRLEGMGEVMSFGAGDYSMRIWLDPGKLKARQLTTTDVINVIREQNVQVAAGQIGQLPSKESMDFQYSVNVQGKLSEVAEFEDIIVRSLPGGKFIRLKDVARVELNAQNYDVSSKTNSMDSASIGIILKPGANALALAKRVRARMEELSVSFPEGMEYTVPFDATTFVEIAIDEVIETLFITIILVVLVILAFLQNWRATVIPLVTIPVSMIGTLAVMYAMGVSINMLSLFGIVLAIGIVVDDAIVVVENVIRHIDESGMNPKEATIRTMKEVTGPVVATTLVLLSVFVPTAFMGGTTGQLYRQFALTIATATVFSTINALTLSPALSAILLRPSSTSKPNIFARLFNGFFDRVQVAYGFIVSGLIRRAFLMLILFAGFTGAAIFGFVELPKGFVPNEDQGWAMIAVQLPDAASLDRTKAVTDRIEEKLAEMPGIKDYISVPGYSIMDDATASNTAVIWTVFEPWEKRLPQGLNLDVMVGQLWGAVSGIQEAMIFAFPPPPILGLGSAGGFTMQIQDRSNMGLDALQQETHKLMMAANGDENLTRVFSTFRANVPQLKADVDRLRTKSLDVPLSDVFSTLQANLGSVYVNDFSYFGKNYQVRVQADSEYRSTPEDITSLEVRSGNGDMIPLGSMVKVVDTFGPQTITRYNLFPAAKLNGQGIPGVSSGAAMDMMEKLAKENLPPGVGFEWTDMSYQEMASRGKTLFILILAVIFVYLVLAAQYESWTLPLSVVLSVPLAVLGTVTAVAIRGMDINVYTQVGLVLLVALSCKTAILITEFAKANRDEGMSIFDAAFTAAKLRFRPIPMTAATFILGMVPLVFATGAGANSRQALGTAVFSGMLSATILLIFFVPSFYSLIQRMSEKALGIMRKNSTDPSKEKQRVAEAS
jgi:HAE1 family hydrophobic/amphiphilic exporter-1